MRLPTRLPIRLTIATALLFCSAGHAGTSQDILDAIKQYGSQSGAASALSQGDILNGLRQALAQGTTNAINQLGRSDGFWKDARVRIPLPSVISRYESPLRAFGAGSQLDQFQLTLNRAAEQAVPQVATIFGNSIQKMTVDDARAILKGSNDAATQFFRRTAGAQLAASIQPIVSQQTASVGVTQQYKKLVKKAGPMMQLSGSTPPADLDSYVTDKALDGLFTRIADEEKQIRANPAARSTELLKKVFGSR